MPELPEVETVVRSINQSIENKEISKLSIINSKLRWPIDTCLPQKAKNQKPTRS